MSRSLVLPTLITLLCGLVGCRAQEESHNLQTSVTRLEQRLARMDDYLKSMQEGQVKQKGEKVMELQAAQQDLAKLREVVNSQERAMREQTVLTERKAAETRRAAEVQADRQEKANADLRAKLERDQRNFEQTQEQAKANHQKTMAEMHAAHAEGMQAQQQVADHRRQVAELRQQLAQSQALAKTRTDDHAHAIDRLGEERRQIERLREAVKNDVAQQASVQQRANADDERKLRSLVLEAARLRQENHQLREQLEAAEHLAAANAQHSPIPPPHPPAASAPGSPGSIIVNNEDGEVHFHFHGSDTPAIERTQARRPAAPAQTAPAPAKQPLAPARAPSRLEPEHVIEIFPIPRATHEAPGLPGEKAKAAKKKESEKKINDEIDELVANFAQAVFGQF